MTWPGVSTGSIQRSPRWWRTRCWRCRSRRAAAEASVSTDAGGDLPAVAVLRQPSGERVSVVMTARRPIAERVELRIELLRELALIELMRPEGRGPVAQLVHAVNIGGGERAQTEHGRRHHPEGGDRHRPPGKGSDRVPTTAQRPSADS